MFWDRLVFEPISEAEPSQTSTMKRSIGRSDGQIVAQLGRTLAEKKAEQGLFSGACGARGHPLSH